MAEFPKLVPVDTCVPEDGSGPCGPVAPTAVPESGRRVYIHEESFATLALQVGGIGEQLYCALSRVAAIKAVHHHLVQDGVMLRRIAAERAEPVLQAIMECWSQDISRVLRRIGYWPVEPQRRYDFFPLLETFETVAASCYDAQYFTFATTPKASVRMFKDTEKIRDLRRSLREGKGEPDLTLIKGHCLAEIDPAIGVGLSKAKIYRSRLARLNQIGEAEFQRLKYNIGASTINALSDLLEEHLVCRTEDEQELVNLLIDSCSDAIHRGILRLPMA